MSKLKDYIVSFTKSNDRKTLITNFGYLSLLQLSSYFFPIITLPYLAKTIGVDGFGSIAFGAAVIMWFQTVSDWGFNYTATRDVAQNRDNQLKISEIFSNVFWSRCFLMFFSFIILVLLILLIPKFNENKEILLITFLLIPGHIMFPDWFFQALERMKYITVFNIISKLLFTIAVFIFIKEKSDYLLQPLLISIGFLISGIISLYIIIIKWNIRLNRPNSKEVYKTIFSSTDVFINNLVPNLYNNFSILLLGFLGGSISNGILDAGSKFVNLANQFMSIISRVFFPFLSRNISKHRHYTYINILISAAISIILFILAPSLIRLFFTSDFYDSIIILRIMSLSILFLSLTNIYGTNYLIIQGHEKKLRNTTLFCSLFGFFISFPLIYHLDYLGAAITIVLTRVLLGLGTMILAKKLEKIKLQ